MRNSPPPNILGLCDYKFGLWPLIDNVMVKADDGLCDYKFGLWPLIDNVMVEVDDCLCDYKSDDGKF